MDRQLERPLLLALTAVYLGVTSWTWSDLSRRPVSSLRGSRGLWRLLSTLNTSGSVAYLLIGRRR